MQSANDVILSTTTSPTIVIFLTAVVASRAGKPPEHPFLATLRVPNAFLTRGWYERMVRTELAYARFVNDWVVLALTR
jgi:hypothetical protein